MKPKIQRAEWESIALHWFSSLLLAGILVYRRDPITRGKGWWILANLIPLSRMVETLMNKESKHINATNIFKQHLYPIFASQIYMIFSFTFANMFCRTCTQLLVNIVLTTIFILAVVVWIVCDSVSLINALEQAGDSIKTIIQFYLSNIIIYFVIKLLDRLARKKILIGFIQRLEVQAENQAILESLEVGIITFTENGLKYFNK